MSSKNLHMLSNTSHKNSSRSIHSHKYNLVSRQSVTSAANHDQNFLTKEEIEQELLKAFDTQISFGQKELPKGLSSQLKKKVRSVSLNSASLRKPFITASLLPQKNLNLINKKPLTRINSSHPTHRSDISRNSHLSSVRSFHHNKRESIASQLIIKNRTKNLVQKLISVKPSEQVSRQNHLESYSKHLHSKHIMMHRYENAKDKKGIILVKKAICCNQHTAVVIKDFHAKKNEELREKRFNAIELKQIELRKMLKDEKKKNRLETLNKLPIQNLSVPGRKNHQRVKTQDARMFIKAIPKTTASSQQPILLPKLRSYSKSENYQKRGRFAVSTPGGYSSNNDRASGTIKKRMKTHF